MKRDAFPDVAELIPHARRMLLLSSVIEHDPDWTTCAVDVDRIHDLLDDVLSAEDVNAVDVKGEAVRLAVYLPCGP